MMDSLVIITNSESFLIVKILIYSSAFVKSFFRKMVGPCNRKVRLATAC
jgi:hypothetical protein